jgi:hypothetical protein
MVDLVYSVISSTGYSLDNVWIQPVRRPPRPCHKYDANLDGYRAEDTFNEGLFAPVVELFG